MASIPLTDIGFKLIPEGTYLFSIEKVEYKQKFNKIEIIFKCETGSTIKASYMLNTDGGIKAFSFLAKTALNDFDADAVDPDALVGKKVVADIEHTELPSNRDPNSTVTFANIRNFKVPEEGDHKSPPNRSMDLSFLDE